LDPFHSTERT